VREPVVQREPPRIELERDCAVPVRHGAREGNGREFEDPAAHTLDWTRALAPSLDITSRLFATLPLPRAWRQRTFEVDAMRRPA
jgi:hypothetical protein